MAGFTAVLRGFRARRQNSVSLPNFQIQVTPPILWPDNPNETFEGLVRCLKPRIEEVTTGDLES